MERDNKNTKLLYAMGWKVIRIWESDIEKNLDECVNTIKEAIFDEELKKVDFDEEYYDWVDMEEWMNTEKIDEIIKILRAIADTST